MINEIYEVTAVQPKTKVAHKVYVRAASAERAYKFGRTMHKILGLRGRFTTRTNIWNPLQDLSIARYIRRSQND